MKTDFALGNSQQTKPWGKDQKFSGEKRGILGIYESIRRYGISASVTLISCHGLRLTKGGKYLETFHLLGLVATPTSANYGFSWSPTRWQLSITWMAGVITNELKAVTSLKKRRVSWLLAEKLSWPTKMTGETTQISKRKGVFRSIQTKVLFLSDKSPSCSRSYRACRQLYHVRGPKLHSEPGKSKLWPISVLVT